MLHTEVSYIWKLSWFLLSCSVMHACFNVWSQLNINFMLHWHWDEYKKWSCFLHCLYPHRSLILFKYSAASALLAWKKYSHKMHAQFKQEYMMTSFLLQIKVMSSSTLGSEDGNVSTNPARLLQLAQTQLLLYSACMWVAGNIIQNLFNMHCSYTASYYMGRRLCQNTVHVRYL